MYILYVYIVRIYVYMGTTPTRAYLELFFVVFICITKTMVLLSSFLCALYTTISLGAWFLRINPDYSRLIQTKSDSSRLQGILVKSLFFEKNLYAKHAQYSLGMCNSPSSLVMAENNAGRHRKLTSHMRKGWLGIDAAFGTYQQDILPYNPNSPNNPNNPNKQLGLKEIGKVSMHFVHVKPEFSNS